MEMYSALSLCEFWSVLTTSTLLSLPNFKRPKSGQPRSKTYFASPRTWTWPSRSPRTAKFIMHNFATLSLSFSSHLPPASMLFTGISIKEAGRGEEKSCPPPPLPSHRPRARCDESQKFRIALERDGGGGGRRASSSSSS